MIDKCTKKITDWLIRCDAVEKQDRLLYEYAVYSILLTLYPVILAIGIGILFGSARRSILIILPFSVIRKFSGGYHAKRAGTCLMSSSLLLLLCIVLTFYIKCGWILMGITAMAAVSLSCFSPLDNENRLLSREEHSCYKKITIMIVMSFVLADLLLFWFHLYLSVVCISIGIILSAGLQLPCILSECYSNLNHTSAAHTTPPVTGVLPLCTRLRRVRRNNPPWRSL